jgi:hypothetical protein
VSSAVACSLAYLASPLTFHHLRWPVPVRGGKTLSMSWSLCRGPGAPVDLTFRDCLCSMSACHKHAVEKKQDTAQQAAPCSTLNDHSSRPREFLRSTTGVSGPADCSGAGPGRGAALPGPIQRGKGPRCLVVLRVAGRTDSIPGRSAKEARGLRPLRPRPTTVRPEVGEIAPTESADGAVVERTRWPSGRLDDARTSLRPCGRPSRRDTNLA